MTPTTTIIRHRDDPATIKAAAWFAGDYRADWLGDTNGCDTPDVFAFLSDWQAEAP